MSCHMSIPLFFASLTSIVHAAFVVEIQDQFGDGISLLRYGSEISVVNQSNNVEWLVDNVPVKSGADPKKIKIGPNVSFGQYEYVIDKQRAKGPKISYYLCDDSGNDCQNGPRCAADITYDVRLAKFCVVKKKNVKQCADLDYASCADVHNNLQSQHQCIGNRAVRTACEAWSIHLPGSAEGTSASFCYRDKNQFEIFFTYNSNTWLPTGWFTLRPDADQLRVECSTDVFYDDKGQMQMIICEKVDKKCSDVKNITCRHVVKLAAPKQNGSISKIVTWASKTGKPDNFIQSFIFAVNMPTSVTIAFDGSDCSKIVCSVQKKSGMFRVKWSIKHDGTIVDSQKSFESSSTKSFQFNVYGNYTCMAEIRFRSCSPFSEYFKTINSESMVFSPCIDQPKGLLVDGEIGESSIALPVALGCVGVLFIFAIIVVACWVIPGKKKKSKAKAPKASKDSSGKSTTKESDVSGMRNGDNNEISRFTGQSTTVTKSPVGKSVIKKPSILSVKKHSVLSIKKHSVLSVLSAEGSKISKLPRSKTLTKKSTLKSVKRKK